MELRHLRYFNAVAHHLSFSEAAKQLNISQPPLSNQIKQLEEELGVSLFKRTSREVKLTDAGVYFLEATKRLLHTLAQDVQTARKIDRGEIGTLRLGFGGSVVFDLLPEIIKHVHQQYPDLQLNVQQLTTSEQVKSLLNGSIDVGIIVPPVNNEKIKTLPIRKEVFVACIPKHHPMARSKHPVDIKVFANDPIIMTPKDAGRSYYNSVLELCLEGGFTPQISQTAQEQQTLVSFVAAGLGIAFVPASTKRIYHANVQYVSLKQQHKKVSAVAWNTEYCLPVVTIFIDLLKKHYMN